MKELYTALIRAQKEIKHAKLDSKNPHFKSEYASLESHITNVKEIFAKHDLGLFQSVSSTDVKNPYVLETTVVHVSGQSLTTHMPLLVNKEDMQGLGSAVTYGRRYAMAAIANMGSEDDDGQKAVIQTSPPKESTIAWERQTIKNHAPQPPPPKPDDSTITSMQQTQLFKYIESTGQTMEQFKVRLKEKYGVLQSRDIKVWQLNELMGVK